MKRKVILFVCALFLFVTPVQAKKVTSKEEVVLSLIEMLSIMEEDYYYPINWQKVYEETLKGVINGTDAYGYFYPTDENPISNDTLDLIQKNLGFGISYQIVDFNGADAVLVKEVFTDSVAKKAGIKRNDVIVKINGKTPTTTGLVEASQSLVAVTVTVERKGEYIEYSLVPEMYSVDAVYTYTTAEWIEAEWIDEKDLPENHEKIGIIAIHVFDANTEKQFSQAVKEMRKAGIEKIVLDLRFNSGGFFAEALAVADILVPEGYQLTLREKTGEELTISGGSKEKTAVPFETVVVLVNQDSASAAEIVAAILQQHGHMVVGSPTFGKGVGQMTYELSGTGDVFRMTVLEVFILDKDNKKVKINDVGVIPNQKASYIDISKEKLTNEEWKTILNEVGYEGDYAKASNALAKDFGLKESGSLGKTGEYFATQLYTIYKESEAKECILAIKLAGQGGGK